MRYAPWWLLAVVCACNEDPKRADLIQRAQFGVFFGGQVQEREQIPFQLDQTKQSHGFRIDFVEELRREIPVKWEIDMPGSTRGVRDRHGRAGKGRLVELGDASAREGQKRFDQGLPFEPGDALGVWNIRVEVDGEIAIDRAFEVYDAEARARRLRDAGR